MSVSHLASERAHVGTGDLQEISRGLARFDPAFESDLVRGSQKSHRADLFQIVSKTIASHSRRPLRTSFVGYEADLIALDLKVRREPSTEFSPYGLGIRR